MVSRKNKIFRDEGYAIISVLMIGLLILSLLLGLLLERYYSSLLSERRIHKKKLENACYSVLQKHIISHPLDYSSGKYITEEDASKIEVKYGVNGLLYSVEIKASTNKDSAKVRYLLAEKMNSIFENALILSRYDINASYTGNTKIKGSILAQNAKISMGSIFGIKSPTEYFHDGEIRVNKNIKNKVLPEKLLKKIFSYEVPNGIKIIDKNIKLSFSDLDDANIIYVIGNISISGTNRSTKHFRGKVKIYAKGQITIDSNSENFRDIEIVTDSTILIKENSHLENVLFLARKGIRILENTSFKNAQLFSTKYIKSEKVQFKYPSILCIYTQSKVNSATDSNRIELKSSILNGSALLVSDVVGDEANKSRIIIDEKSIVHGIIYSENNCEILGPVKGAVYTYNLWFYKAPSEYINWLVNLHIYRNELDNNYLLPIGLGDNIKSLQLLKEEWIY